MDPFGLQELRSIRIPKVAYPAAAAAIAILIYLAWTSGRWLPRLLGALDRFLTRIGFGSYTVRFLTWMEDRFGEKWGRKDS